MGSDTLDMARTFEPTVGHAALKIAWDFHSLWRHEVALVSARRMRKRRISEQEALEALNNFHTDLPAEIEGARVLIGTVGSREIAVVAKPMREDMYRLCSTWAIGEEDS